MSKGKSFIGSPELDQKIQHALVKVTPPHGSRKTREWRQVNTMKTIFQERVVEGPDTFRMYLKDLAKFPQLTPEQEHDLSVRARGGR